jgi:hypothetical protein
MKVAPNNCRGEVSAAAATSIPALFIAANFNLIAQGAVSSLQIKPKETQLGHL